MQLPKYIQTRRVFLIIFLMGIVASPVRAHATLERSNPPANTALEAPPNEIRMWFTEPLEPQYARILIRDTSGIVMTTPPAVVDPSDPFQMFVIPGVLTEGLYTVSWRVVSSADGHPTEGSFAFGVGTAVSFENITIAEEPIPTDSAFVRWLNLFTMALAIGTLGFNLFVWTPAAPGTNTLMDRRMMLLVWAGWLALGVAGVLALVLQVSVSNGIPLLSAFDFSLLSRIISGSRYGNLWLIRMALWLGFAMALLFARSDRWFYWVAMGLGGGILLTNSLYSHASGLPNTPATVAADWIHLLASTLWIGGLVQIVNVLSIGRRDDPLLPTPEVSRVVAYFSNYARVCVSILVLTGIYAAWLHVGTLDALLTTQYGQALLVKLVLFAPLIGLAAVNLIVTYRKLQAGEMVWIGRLRSLVTAEVVLTVSILGAVGVMTAIQPARGVLTQRTPRVPSPQPIVETQTADDLNIQLEITPGWVGSNTFNITLTDADGSPITDATRIRMRFTSSGVGESELRPEHIGDGVYSIIGENLSLTGDWRIRTTVARPQKFDAVVDFEPSLGLAPPPPLPPSPIPPLNSRIFALLLTGIAALGLGGFFAAQNRLSLSTGDGLLTIALFVVGVILLGSGLLDMRGTPVAAESGETTYIPSNGSPIDLAIRDGMDFPYLIMNDGQLLQPQSSSNWKNIGLDAQILDVYLGGEKRVFAASDRGLLFYDDIESEWVILDTTPLKHVESMHGYLFALADQEVLRFQELPGGELSFVKNNELLVTDETLGDMVMLGDHSHVLQVGDLLFSTPDLGLSWQPLDNPSPANIISVDADGKLLAVTDSGILRRSDSAWQNYMSLVENMPITSLQIFNEKLYALADGKLFVQIGNEWAQVTPPETADAYFTAMTVQYPQTLWLLDTKGERLWSSDDGQVWTITPISVE